MWWRVLKNALQVHIGGNKDHSQCLFVWLSAPISSVPLMFFNRLANFNQNLAEGKDHLNFQEIRQQRKEKVKQELEPREELECECSLRQPSVHMGKSYNKHLKQGKAFPQPCKTLQDMRLQESRCHLI